jgi:hypothetical protein
MRIFFSLKKKIYFLPSSIPSMLRGEDFVCCSITELRHGYADSEWEGLLNGDIRNKFLKLLAATEQQG